MLAILTFNPQWIVPDILVALKNVVKFDIAQAALEPSEGLATPPSITYTTQKCVSTPKEVCANC